jgi:hypothetical protein
MEVNFLNTKLFISDVAVAIETPNHRVEPVRKNQQDFLFDKDDRFTDYYYSASNNQYILSRDDSDQWYFFHSFECQSLKELKNSRQIYRPGYMKEDEKLPLKDLMNALMLKPRNEGFDKAYGHALYSVQCLDSLSAEQQMRIANYDGPDDPVIANMIHFIENEYKGEKTRYIAGFETRSFATVSENDYYVRNIHRPFNSINYLKLFIYFSRYQTLPSHQMMPRFLGNLWASAQTLTNHANPALYVRQSID